MTVGSITSTIHNLLYPGAALSTAWQDAILGEGYSVANDANTTTTVPETQGFTNYELIRYDDSDHHPTQLNYTDNSYNTRETTYDSQVNEGQITTYPYDINTALSRVRAQLTT